MFFRLIAAGRIDGELGEDFAGAVLDGSDVGVSDEQDDGFVFVGAADAEVSEASGMAQCDLAVGVHAVGADPPVLSLGRDGGPGLGGCLVGFGRCAAFEGAVRPFVVIELLELGQELVQVGDCVRLGLMLEPFFEGLVEAFNLALGLGVAGTAVLLSDAQGRDESFEGVSSAAAASEAGGVDEAVVGERGGGQAVLLRGVQEGIDHDGSGDSGGGA